MSTCILRVAKLKTAGNIVGSGRHNYREAQTDNADSARTPLNKTNGAQSSAELLAAVQARLSTVSHVRENAVLAVEYFIGASPEFFKSKPNEVENYFDRAEQWLKDKHGADNVVAVTRQYDETSPHICAYVVPIDERGKLNASKFLDGRKKLSELQTDFAKQCGAPFGLVRGIEGSKAKHIECSDYYAVVNSKTPQVTTEIPPDRRPTFFENIGLNNDYAELQKRRKEAIAKRDAEERRQRIALENKAKQLELERANNRARDVAVADLRANSAQLREIPLEDVLKHLGCRPDPSDPKNWITRAGRLTVDGRKFYLHDAGGGGGGAIDLVKSIEETDYKGALRILHEGFGTDAVVSHELARAKAHVEKIVQAPTVFVPPAPSPENWPKVRSYLTNTRKLAVDLVDKFHRIGKIYADKFANAVFVLGQAEGVALRGTGDVKFHGVRGKKAPFILTGDLKAKTREVAFTESCIDALSLRQMGFVGEIVATSGQSGKSARELADGYRMLRFEVVAAFDDDKAGNLMADAIGALRRIGPRGGAKDWNAELMAAKPPSPTPTPKPQAPEPEPEPDRSFRPR